MDIKLIAIDIDGTLLNEKNELAQATIDAIKAAAAKGIKVALCSGRPLSGIRPYLKPLGIEGDEQYAIAFNGSVTETVSGKLISKMGINYEDFLQIEMIPHYPRGQLPYYRLWPASQQLPSVLSRTRWTKLRQPQPRSYRQYQRL